MENNKTITFEFEKDTKNTYRYKEKVGEIKAVGPIYIQKDFIKKVYPGDTNPKTFKITFDFEE